MLVRRRKQPSREALDPLAARRRHSQCEGHPERPRGHRRNIRQVDRDDAITKIGRRNSVGEVSAFDQRVDDGDEFLAGLGAQHRSIVADTDNHTLAFASADEVAPDQFKLIHRSRHCAVTARRHRGMR